MKHQKEYFPEYILVRRPMDRDAMKAREEEQRMDLLTKEVRRISLSVAEIKSEQRTKTNDEIKEIKDILKQMAEHMQFKQGSPTKQGSPAKHSEK